MIFEKLSPDTAFRAFYEEIQKEPLSVKEEALMAKLLDELTEEDE